MTPDQAKNLRERKWSHWAKTMRATLRERLASVLHKSPEWITFTDYDETQDVIRIFSMLDKTARTVEIPDRTSAIAWIRAAIVGKHSDVFLMCRDYWQTGALRANLTDIEPYVDELVAAQEEYLGMLSLNGTFSLCCVTQEGSDPSYPRYLSICDSGDENEINEELVTKLRLRARSGAPVKALVDEVRSFLGTTDGLALVVARYFCKAFFLGLEDVRDIEGSACLGHSLYSEEEIDQLMKPRIEKTRPRWEGAIPKSCG